MIIVSPFVTAFKMALIFGKYVTSRLVDDYKMKKIAGRERKDFTEIVGAFGVGLLHFPIIIVMFSVMWPPVFLYKVWVLLGIVFRNFICCCCC